MKVSAPLLRKVRDWLQRQQVPPDNLMVAVSGGPDSVALLHALIALRSPNQSSSLIVAHLNHQLRGTESDADEAFVRQLHDDLQRAGVRGLECVSERIDVAARAVGSNLEATARQIRYDWLTHLAREKHIPRIATGHTADDQAETVLHRLLRGTGLQGLRGIAARRELIPGVELIRPLLQVSRSEVLAYLESERVPYRHDSSNLDCRFTRNRIRHELLPLLAREYNPAITSLLAQLAEQAEEIFREQDKLVRQLLADVERPRAGAQVVLDRQRLAAALRHLVREVLRLLWDREGWPVGAMRFDHWDRAAAVVFGELPVAELPDGLSVRGRERVVLVGPSS